MPRGRFSVACVLRLLVYGVAIITVHHAGDPAVALLLVLLLGMVLELLVGAIRWR